MFFETQCMFANCNESSLGWWHGIAVTSFIWSTKLLYAGWAGSVLGQVTACGQVNHIGMKPAN